MRYEHTLPPVEEFYPLFLSTGWNERLKLTQDQLAAALHASWFGVSVYSGSSLVGTGRLLSDGVYQCIICDVIVRPDHQGLGIGREIIRLLLEHGRTCGIRWMQLTSARGKRGFYEKLGFSARPDDAPGMDIWL